MADSRIALIGIIVEDPNAADLINGLLHQYRDSIVGRMGIPYRPEKLSIISVVIDAPESLTSQLAGKLGMIDGVNVKTVYSKKYERL